MNNQAPTKIAVVGLGAWGSALALHCARLGHAVVRQILFRRIRFGEPIS